MYDQFIVCISYKLTLVLPRGGHFDPGRRKNVFFYSKNYCIALIFSVAGDKMHFANNKIKMGFLALAV